MEGAPSYIVDLRQYVGGILHASAHLASIFLYPESPLWTIFDRDEELTETDVTCPVAGLEGRVAKKTGRRLAMRPNSQVRRRMALDRALAIITSKS